MGRSAQPDWIAAHSPGPWIAIRSCSAGSLLPRSMPWVRAAISAEFFAVAEEYDCHRGIRRSKAPWSPWPSPDYARTMSSARSIPLVGTTPSLSRLPHSRSQKRPVYSVRNFLRRQPRHPLTRSGSCAPPARRYEKQGRPYHVVINHARHSVPPIWIAGATRESWRHREAVCKSHPVDTTRCVVFFSLPGNAPPPFRWNPGIRFDILGRFT